MKRLKLLLLSLLCSTILPAQNITPYGGYLYRFLSPNNFCSWNAVIYSPVDLAIPDSIYFKKRTSRDNFIQLSSEEYLYDNIVKKTYSWIDTLNLGGFNGIEAFYPDNPVRYKGKNSDTTRRFSVLLAWPTPSWIESSIVLKDYPLVTIEKGRSSNFNLLESLPNGDADSIAFNVKHGIGIGIKSFSLNRYTGDIFIDTKEMDTGFYALELNSAQYIKRNSNSWMESFINQYYFTLHVVNEPVSYFIIPEPVKKDYLNAPYIMINPTDSMIKYECDFIVPSGFNSLDVSYQSIFAFTKQPEVKWEKTNDTTAHISIDIYLNRELKYPQSVSLLVKRKGSGDQYSQDMTSFYITRNFLEK